MIRLHVRADLQARSAEVLQAGFVLIRRHLTVAAAIAAAVSVPLTLATGTWWAAGVLAFVVAGAAGMALVDAAYAHALARLAYVRAAGVQSATAVIRLAVTAAVAGLLPGSLGPVMLTYAGVSLACGLSVAAAVTWGGRVRVRPDVVSLLFRYSIWQGWVNMLAALGLHQGAFLLQILGQKDAAGVFGVALAAAVPFYTASAVLNDYLISRLARLTARAQLAGQMKRAYVGALVLVLIVAPAALAADAVAPLVLRDEVLTMLPAFYWLVAAHILLILQSPLEAACHALMRPDLVALGRVIRVVLVAAAGVALCPSLGAVGAGIAQVAGVALGLVVHAVIVVRAVRSREPAGGWMAAGQTDGAGSAW
jgi:O-antigen/teichoic acid export membrane protein